jgi:four helix bundle suffix protein
VQAARSWVQNIAEGSQASDTSKKTELELTNVARASLEKLRLDFQDFFRQRGWPEFAPDHLALKRSSLEEVRERVKTERHMDLHGPARTDTDKNEKLEKSVGVSDRPCLSMSNSTLVVNAALSLLNFCCYFLDRQFSAQAASFEKEGGFTE